MHTKELNAAGCIGKCHYADHQPLLFHHKGSLLPDEFLQFFHIIGFIQVRISVDRQPNQLHPPGNIFLLRQTDIFSVRFIHSIRRCLSAQMKLQLQWIEFAVSPILCGREFVHGLKRIGK